MIGTGMSGGGNDFASKFTEAALHAIAHHRVPNPLGDGETDAPRWIAILAITDEKDESRRRRTPTGVRSEEVRAFPKDC
jgi:hypothetical protein